MKSTTILLAALLGLAAATALATDESAIRTEVIQTIQRMIAAAERLDPVATWAVHADVPGYRWVDTAGTTYDFADTKKAWADYLAGSAKLKYTTLHEEVLVLAPDLAFYTWTGSADVTPKDGPRTRHEQWTARYLCRYSDGAWKIIGGQESSAPGKVVILSPAATTSAEEQLRARDAAWLHAIASRSLEDTLPFYDAEATTAGSVMFPAQGLPAFRAAWAKVFANPSFALSWTTEQISFLDSGSLACATGTWRTPGAEANGPYLALWRRQTDGQWKVLIDAAWAQRSLPASASGAHVLARSREHRINSTAVGDSFLVQVRLPENYDPGTHRYPVLYVLDGDYWFGAASDIATYLTMVKEGPPTIVVGVAYGGTSGLWWNTRARDLTPPQRFGDEKRFPAVAGADRFRRFLADELIPFVERSYSARADDRTLAGLSFGGLFAVHTLFEQPGLFQNYIILAPSVEWDRRILFDTEAKLAANKTPLPATVFFAFGDREEVADVSTYRAFDQQVRSHDHPGLHWTSHVFPGETHISVYPVGLTRGLKTIHRASVTAAPAPTIPDPLAASAAFEAYLEFWNKHDAPALARAFSPDLIYHYNGTIIPAAPKDHLAALKEFGGALPDLVGRIDHFAFTDGIGAASTTWIGTHQGQLSGIPATGGKPVPPTGRKVTMSTNYLFRVEAGRIVELWETWDEGGIYQQLLRPEPTKANP